MRLLHTDLNETGNIIFDNGELYFEPGNYEEWEYPEDTTIQEITWWYKIIAVMSGIEVKVDFKKLKLV